MAKLPVNVVNFATVNGEANTQAYELFADYYNHFSAERLQKNIGSYDTTKTFAEKEGKMNSVLLDEISRMAGVEVTADNAKLMAKNPQVIWASMAVVENMIDVVLPNVMVEFAPFADIRNIGYGDSASFEIEPRTLFTTSEVGNALRHTHVQKDFKTTKTLVAQNHMITVQAELYRVLCGQESLAEFARKAIMSIERDFAADIYGHFSAALKAVTMPSQLKVTGYTQDDLLKICERVTSYNGGAKAVIMGTPVALSKILPNGASGYRIITDSDNMKLALIRDFFGYQVIEMEQVATGDYTDFGMVLDDDMIYVVSPGADKPIKAVVEGSDVNYTNDFYDHANLTSNFTINKRWNAMFASNAIAGAVELQ